MAIKHAACLGKRAENIVRLPARAFHRFEAERRKDLFEYGQLHTQFLRHGMPAGLIFRILLMPKRRGVHIKRNAHRIRLRNLL